MNLSYHFAIAAETETTLWEDILNYLYDVYLRVDGNYQNLGFEKMPLFSLRLTVLGIFIGTIFACVAMAYNKQVLGGIVRKSIADGCLSKDTAKTADELGYTKNLLARNALRDSASLRRFVKCVEEDEFYAEQEESKKVYEQKRQEKPSLPKFKERKYLTDLSAAHFYIPEELRIRAELRFSNKGSGVLSTILAIIALAILFFCVLLVLPAMLGYVDGLL